MVSPVDVRLPCFDGGESGISGLCRAGSEPAVCSPESKANDGKVQLKAGAMPVHLDYRPAAARRRHQGANHALTPTCKRRHFIKKKKMPP